MKHLSKKQRIWLRIAQAFDTPNSRLAEYGLCHALLVKRGSAISQQLVEALDRAGWLNAADYLDMGHGAPYPSYNDRAVRATLAGLLAAMTDAERAEAFFGLDI